MHVDGHVNDCNDDNDNDDDIFFVGWLWRSTNKLLQLIVNKKCYCKFLPHKMLMNECLFI